MMKILLLCGGQSPEHEVSILSARNIMQAIKQLGYEVTIIGISKKGTWNILESLSNLSQVVDTKTPVSIIPGSKEPFLCETKNLGKFDVVFPVLHGPNGEDGAIQGLLKLLHLPFVGTGILGSTICMDKDVAKRLLQSANLKVAEWLLIHEYEAPHAYQNAVERLGSGEWFVKPANMGSSVGISWVTNEKEWEMALQNAFLYDEKVLVEKRIKGRELECAVLGNHAPIASEVGEVHARGFYSYNEKYATTSATQLDIPAQIDAENLSKLQKTAIDAYKILNVKGLARVDMFLTQDHHIYVNEVNTLPGFTDISMYPKLWKEKGMPLEKLIEHLIQLSLEIHTNDATLQ